MQVKTILALLSFFLPLVASTVLTSSSCNKTEFWWQDKKCCLPKGGIPTPPTPPKGSNCPPTSYYWSHDKGCCVPRNLPPSNPPPPQCPKNWTWYPALWKCMQTPTPPTPPPSNPSPKPGDKDCDDKDKGKNTNNNNNNSNNNNSNNNNNNNYPGRHRRREGKERQTLCPTGLDACPVRALDGDYECLDYATELEFCGGCTTLGKGQDCTAIEGAWNVGCDQGTCVVFTCAGGFKRSTDKKSCIPA